MQSAVELRDFQLAKSIEIDYQWALGNRNVCYVASTGSGKTVVLAHKMQEEPGASLATAHRRELVSQMSMALARNGLRHRILASCSGAASPLLRAIVAAHVFEFGDSYVDAHARAAVVGVDTLLRCNPQDEFLQSVRLQVQDEAHHVLRSNKWGRAAELLPNARGLFPTATPRRADGAGLGRHADGVMDAMVLAPSMREIIDMGFLTDYRLYCPMSSKLNRDAIKISEATGEFSQQSAAEAVRRAEIVGDTVQAYLRHGQNSAAVVFCVSVEEAERTAKAFCAAGVPAAHLSAESTDSERLGRVADLRAGRLKVLTNVDLFGEGFDLPAIRTVIMARPTMSWALFVQQFGRALRLLLPEWAKAGYNGMSPAQRRAVIAESEKPYGIIIDQVGNIDYHAARGGLPDAPQVFTMDRRERRSMSERDPDKVPLRVCLSWTDPETGYQHEGCLRPYERIYDVCPYCGCPAEPPKERTAPEHVDGDFIELSPETLARLRGEIAHIDGPCYTPRGVPPYVAASIRTKHQERQTAQSELREAVAWWAGYRGACGDTEREGYRRFYFKYGVDVASAQTLGATDARALAKRVRADLIAAGVTGMPFAENA